jgi:tetratricopeptide (TPR) repeat protein
VCKSRIKPDALLDSSQHALAEARQNFGVAHANTLLRTLDVAIALSATRGHKQKKRLLDGLLKRAKPTRATNWIHAVARLEYGRACMELCHYDTGKQALLPLLALDRSTHEKLLSLVFAEGLCLLGRAYMGLGQKDSAWSTLQFAVSVAADNKEKHGAAYSLVNALRTKAEYQTACGAFRQAAHTLLEVTAIIDGSETDECDRACAHVDAAAAEIKASLFADAAGRLRKSLRVLRTRKRDEYASDAAFRASLMLSSLIVPARRVRGKQHPEDICYSWPRDIEHGSSHSLSGNA